MEAQLLLASLRGSLRSVSGSEPGTFQTTAYVLELRACEFLCVPFKTGVSISYNLLALPNISSTGFQSQMF